MNHHRENLGGKISWGECNEHTKHQPSYNLTFFVGDAWAVYDEEQALRTNTLSDGQKKKTSQ